MLMEEEIIKNKLKPCPFCGGDARFTYTTYEEPPMYSVVCTKCKLMIKTYGKDENGNKTDLCYTSISQAAKAWNKRTSPTGAESEDKYDEFGFFNPFSVNHEEQESCTDVLDKVRAEIEQTAKDYDKFDDYRRVRGLWIALEIIDKYKAERSE